MKISTFALGIATAAVSIIASNSTEAATLVFADSSISLTANIFEFEFILPTKGEFKSTLFVADAFKASVQTLFEESGFGDNSAITPTTSVFSGTWALTSDTYSLGWSSLRPPDTTNIFQTVYSDQSAPVQFQFVEQVSDWYTFAIEDKRANGAFLSDYDYNDGKFRVRAVPVPAIASGIVVAAVFFGCKSLRRNKKASESVS